VGASFVVHGHFYQPPRENPWTEEVDREPSAAPFHDWNQRIFKECYRANAYARIVDDRGRVVRIVNNYVHMSFNFGPTLLQWMERHHPITYGRILEADRISLERRGYGNALAQAYNHTILPLDAPRDRRTQIRWGLSDFRKRFHRPADGMWLPEAAINAEVVDTLIEEGVGFVVLSPHQATGFRKLGDPTWTQVERGAIDPTRPYLIRHRIHPERTLSVLFYDGPKSRAVAFERSISTSQRLVDSLMDHAPSQGLVALATDGESYGHHTVFGDRTLAHAFEMEGPRRSLEFTNFAAWLAENEPAHEVCLWSGDNGRGSSWSCAHGVGRWIRDCGCQTGGAPEWNQRWRTPLRAGLDALREKASQVFEDRGSELFEDPWEARDAYVEILGASPVAFERWSRERQKRPWTDEDTVTARTLLEMQRHALLMYTSCAWFFHDISGIETIQILKYARRCIDDLEALGAPSFEPILLEHLAEAESNLPEKGTGADIYRNHVPRARVTAERVVGHLAISSVMDGMPSGGSLGAFAYETTDFQKTSVPPLTLCTARVKLRSESTGRQSHFGFAALHFGGIDFYAVVRPNPHVEAFSARSRKLHDLMDEASLPVLLRETFESLGPREYRLEDLLPGGAEKLAKEVFGSLLDRFFEAYAQLYRDHGRTMEMLQAAGFELPRELRAAAEFTLQHRFEEEIRRQEESRDPRAYRRAIQIAQEVSDRGYQIDRTSSSRVFEAMLNRSVQQALRMADAASVQTVQEIVELIQRLALEVSIEQSQEAVVEAVRRRRVPPEIRGPLGEALFISPEAFS
jgi:alpha-amylase/alpha-mannosidase (GH57 family)